MISKRRLLISAMSLCLCMGIASCTKNESSSSSSSSSQQDAENITLSVSASEDKIKLACEGGSLGKTYNIVSLPAYQYLEGEENHGVSEEIVSIKDSNVVTTYTGGDNKTLETNRISKQTASVYDEDEDEYVNKEVDFDNIYSKYYVVSGNDILLGPIYVTDIDAKVTDQPILSNKSKKGLFGEDLGAYEDLGCSYVTLNLNIDTLIKPNEYIYDGEKIHLDYSNDPKAMPFVCNGKTFYFNKDRVDYFDELIGSYYDLGASITGIIVATKNADDMEFPSTLTYPYSKESVDGIMALNTSNEFGFEYFAAMIEFLTDRYSSNNFEHGFINNYVIGNEIDFAREYNRISEKQVSLDTYMEEYYRLLRLTYLASHKYHSDINVAMPVTQNWTTPGYTVALGGVAAYAPKDMVDWLNKTSKAQGDFPWALAPHSYGVHLAQAYVYWIDTNESLGQMTGGRGYGMTNDVNTSKVITLSNLELLDQYFKQESFLYKGSPRKIFLTETGVSSCYGSEDELKSQAGYIAAAWYKISQLSTIVSWNYYRPYDHKTEMERYALFGLKDVNGKKKLAYNLYKYIDTQYSETVAKPYLNYVKYLDEDGVTHAVLAGNCSSYLDFLDVFGTGYDFSKFSWSLAKPRMIDTVYEFEDTEDLTGLNFASRTFLYDGNEKKIEVTGLPSGLTVTYDDNTRTEKGTQKVLATIKRGDTVVGRREASLTITEKFATNKTTYNYGENIYITAGKESSSKDWIGIFAKDAKIGDTSSENHTSYYYYYPNKGDGFLRSTLLQQQAYFNHSDYENNKTLPAGEYKICYLLNDGYEVGESINITILADGETSNEIDLSGIKFEDSTKELSSSSVSLEISGTLPTGVTVAYENNTLSKVGSVNACAIFTYQGVEIERRYALLTALSAEDTLSTDKTSYQAGEAVMVTAVGGESSWVGVYQKDDVIGKVDSIYWYNVSEHKGVAVNIKETTYNSSRALYSGLPAGEYKIVLFKDGGYTPSKTVNITVTGEETSRITLEKTIFKVGESINVSLRVKSEYDWVGIFKADAASYGDSTLLGYYSPKTEGNKSINNVKVDILAKCSGGLAAGSYKIVAFADGGYSLPYEEVTITIQEA